MNSKHWLHTITAGMMLAVMAFTSDLYATPDSVDATIGVSAADFNYKEFDSNNRLLDREDGILPGLRLDGRLFYGLFFLGLKLDYSRAEADYEAPINNATTLRSTTDEAIINYALSGGRQWQINDNIRLTTTLGIGERRWKRDIYSIPSASGLLEEYRWPYINVGAEGRYQLNAQHSLALCLDWYQVQNADIEVEFKHGQFDTITFDLPDGDGYQAGIRWEYLWQPSLTLSVAPIYRSWDIPRSDAFPLKANGTATNRLVTEPRSETQVFEVVFAVKKQW